jgi:hypothetical protein
MSQTTVAPLLWRQRHTAVLQGLQETCASTSAGPQGIADEVRKYAAELVALAPEVILAFSSAAVAPLLEAIRTVPIAFAGNSDAPNCRGRSIGRWFLPE